MVLTGLLTLNISSMGGGQDPKFEDPPFTPAAPQKIEPSASNAFRILFVGNSITRHGVVLDPYKWDHTAGMAASREDKDFAHRLAAMIQNTMPARKVELYFGDVNKLLRKDNPGNPLDGEKAPPPHLVVIQTGEHEGPKKSKMEVATIYEAQLIKPFYDVTPRPLILCTGLWYVTDGTPYVGWVREINDAYQEVCQKYNIPFASVESLASDPSCRGWGEHPGVKWHPNDKGMEGYANLLFEAYQKADRHTSPSNKNLGGGKNAPFVVSEDFTDGKTVGPEFKIDPLYWKISDHVLKTINAVERMITFQVGEPNWQDYEVEFKVKRIKLNPKDQHFGLLVRCNGEDLSTTTNSLRFYSDGNGICFIEESGKKRIRHGILGTFPKSLGIGEAADWTSFRFVLTGTQAKGYVNNVLIGTLDGVIPQDGKIVFYAYNLELWLDDVKVLVMKSTDRPQNMPDKISNILNNSGFEQCTLDRLPDFWGCLAWGIVDPYWVVNYGEWVNGYAVDDDAPFEGKHSMRIHNPFDNVDRSALCLRSVCLGTRVGQTYTFSAYLRSQPSGMKVNFNGQEITLTDTWRRYSNLFVNDGKGLESDMLNVYPLGKGAFWIDAVQLEEGEVLTPYRRLARDASLQVQEGKVEKVITEVPRYEPKRLNATVTLDGRLDDPVWGTVETVRLVKLNGQPASERTEAQMWYGNDGLYIGVKCFDEKACQNVCKEGQRESTVWNDPSIELFVDPKLTRNYYYHLAMNQIGTQFDAFCGDVSWSGSWRAATHTDPSGKYWSAEFFLPFGEMGIDPGAGEWWGVNICRSNPNQQEYSAWSPTFGGFHTPERFGQVRIAQDVLNRYCVECCNAELQRGSDDKVMLSAEMVNHSGKDGDFLLEAALENATDKTTVNFKQPIRLANGERKVITLGDVAGAAATTYNLRVRLSSADGGTVYYTGNKYLEMPGYFQLLPQYSLYTNEAEMVIKAQINLSTDHLRAAKLELALCTSDGKTVSRKALSVLGREMDITFNIKDLANGKYSLNATLETMAGKTLASLRTPFLKLPPVQHEVKVDHLARMVAVNGTCFMPLGFCWEGELTPEVLEYLARNGVNSITFFPHGNLVKTQSVLDHAEKVGIMIKIGLSAEDQEQTIKFINRFKTHPGLLAWDIFDEAFTIPWGKDNYPLIRDRCAELKAIDPYHPVFINENQYGISYLHAKNLEFPGDIVSIDYYAWPPSGNLPITSRYTQLMAAMGSKDGRPSWIYLLGAGYAFWASRDYTPAEHEFSAYASVINGVSGIYYFASHPKSPSAWERIKGVLGELKELTPVIASSARAPAVKCAAPEIEFLVKKYQGSVFIIAVNSSRTPVDARFHLPALNLRDRKTIAVLFEGRTLTVSNHAIADTFAGYQRHIYKIEDR